MRYMNVDDQFVADILTANKISKTEQDLKESAEVVVDETLAEAEEVHACPLCESELDAPISEEAMQECVDFVLATLNEAAALEEQMLDEAADEDDDEEDDEEDGEENSEEDEDEDDEDK